MAADGSVWVEDSSSPKPRLVELLEEYSIKDATRTVSKETIGETAEIVAAHSSSGRTPHEQFNFIARIASKVKSTPAEEGLPCTDYTIHEYARRYLRPGLTCCDDTDQLVREFLPPVSIKKVDDKDVVVEEDDIEFLTEAESKEITLVHRARIAPAYAARSLLEKLEEIDEMTEILHDLTGNSPCHTEAQRVSHFLSLLDELDLRHAVKGPIAKRPTVSEIELTIREFHQDALDDGRIKLVQELPRRVRDTTFPRLNSIESKHEKAEYIKAQFADAPEGAFHEVRGLYLQDSRIRILPPEVGNLTALEWLDLDNNKLSALPDSFGNLAALKELHLKQNKLSALPDSIGNLTALEWLLLDQNKLSALPDSFGNLAALQVLTLSKNKLSALPDSIGSLTALIRLDLNQNKLSALPDSIDKLVALEQLRVNQNKLSALPDSIGKLTALQKLYLNQNKLSALPDSIGNLAALKLLWISTNKLSALPDSIGNLTALEWLRLDQNKLSVLPESIGNLTALEMLTLSINELSALPESIGNLTMLGYLRLDQNKLSALPSSMRPMKERLVLPDLPFIDRWTYSHCTIC